MDKARKICDRITTVMSFVSIAVVVTMVALVFLDVFLRYVFKAPIVGSTELTQMMLLCMVLGWGRSARGSDNLKIDIVVDSFPRRVAIVIDIIVTILMIGIALLVAWRLVINAEVSKGFGMYYSLLKFQQWPFMVIMSVGYLGGCVGLLAKIFGYVDELRQLRAAGKDAARGDAQEGKQ